jgi:hypothetical protein
MLWLITGTIISVIGIGLIKSFEAQFIGIITLLVGAAIILKKK